MRYILRIILGLIGVGILFLGLNIGLGGIQTLGWQGAGPFITITDMDLFNVRDNHIRFLGGVWLAIGAIFCAATFWLARLKTTLVLLCGAIFIGGLTRLSSPDVTLVLTPEIAPSLIAELIVFPVIGIWIWKQEPRHD